MTPSPTAPAGPADPGAYCPGCGYDLRGSPGGRCPECGLERDAVPARLAWERRRELGRLRTFARAAWLATAHPDRLVRLTAAPVDLPSARRFRRVVLAVVAAAVTVAFVTTVRDQGGPAVFNVVPDPRYGPSPLVTAPVVFWSAGASLWPVLPIGFGIALLVGTRWDHWMALGTAHPVLRQRAIVAARYTVAPLLAVAVAVACLTVGRVPGLLSRRAAGLSDSVAVLYGGAAVLLTGVAPARFTLAMPLAGRLRAAVVLAGTVVQWAVAVAVGIALFPAVVGLLWVMADSLR